MKTLLESLSLGSGAVIVAVCSALLTAMWLCMRSGKSVWFVALGASLIISICLYWLPVWLGANSSEYFSWAFLVIGFWFLAGAISSSIIILIFRKRRLK